MTKSPEKTEILLDEPALRRAEQLDALDTIFPFGRRDQLATLLSDDDVAALTQLCAEGGKQNTIRALASDLAYLQAWCLAVTGAPLPWPAPESLLHTFVAHHLGDPRSPAADSDRGMPAHVEQQLREQALLKTTPPHAASTVRRRIASWSMLTTHRRLSGAFAIPAFRETLRIAAATSDARPPQPMSATPITGDVLKRLLKTCLTDGLVDTRDRAVLLLAFASGGRRRSELANLRVDDLLIRTDATTHATPQRHARSKIKMRIGDVARGDEVTITGRPAEALLRWIERAGIVSGPVFRKVDQWGNVSRRMLTPQSINLIVKARAEKAGLDPQLVSAHGLRTGYRLDTAKRDGPKRQSKQQKKPIRKDLGPKPGLDAAS